MFSMERCIHSCDILESTVPNYSSGNWILGAISMSPMVKLDDTELVKVSDLIDVENWNWRSDLVWASFVAPDADVILNHERSGVYLACFS
jgi:hypothetical protein